MKALNALQSSWYYSIQNNLLNRAVLLDLFAITDVPNLGTIRMPVGNKDFFSLVPGQEFKFDLPYDPVVCKINGMIFGIKKEDGMGTVDYVRLDTPEAGQPILYPHTTLEIIPKYIANYVGPKPPIEKTTVGRFLVNYAWYIQPFKDMIPYQNGVANIKDMENRISELKLNNAIDLSQYPEDATTPYDQFYNNYYFLCGFGDLFIPVYSRKSLQTSPEVLKLKEELLEKHKHELDNPVVITQIEDKLIQADREWLKDDPSYGFYGSDKKKFDVHRKKLFLTGGLQTSFGTTTTEFTFLKSSLAEGWTKEEFPSICNEIRKGSYDRGIETAKGGEASKYLLRVFQNTVLQEHDCATLDGIDCDEFTGAGLTEFIAKEFFNRTIVYDGKTYLLSEENYKQFLGKPVKLRSLMHCKTKPGGCFICAGKIYEQLNVNSIGIFSLKIGSTFMLDSMKSMHGKKSEMFEVTNLSDYMISTVMTA